MKKKIVLIVLALLLGGSLAACDMLVPGGVEEECKVEAYQEVESAFFAALMEWEYRETSIEWEMLFDLQVAGAIPMQVVGALQEGPDHFTDAAEIRDEDGDMLFQIELLYVDGAGYLDIVAMMQPILDAMFDEMGMGFITLSLEELMGEYTHLRLSEEDLEEMMESYRERMIGRRGIYRSFSEEELEEYLSWEHDIFRIELEGEAVYDHVAALMNEIGLDGDGIEAILLPLEMAGDVDFGLILELEDDFVGWLLDSNFTGARLSIEREIMDEGVYRQAFELNIPNRVAIAYEMTLTAGPIDPVSPPEHYFSSELDFERHIQERIMEAMGGLMGDFFPGFGTGMLWDEILDGALHDLPAINLIDHNLAGSRGLETYTFTSRSGETFDLTVAQDGIIDDLPMWGREGIFQDAWAIELYYSVWDRGDVLSIIEDIVSDDLQWLSMMDVDIEKGFPLRLSSDGSAALYAFNMEDFLIYVYLVQEIPGSDYVVSLELVFYVGLWEREDTLILEELSELIGVDLFVFMPGIMA